MKYRNAPILRVGTIEVRAYEQRDAPALQRAANFPSIATMTASLPSPYRLRHAQSWITLCRRRYAWPQSIERHYGIYDNDRLIGAIGASRHGDEAEIGYWLTPAYWGRGIMSGVVRRFIRTVFGWWTIERIVARVFPKNIGSRRVLEKNGFRQTALQVAAIRKGSRRMDVLVFTRYRKR